MTPQTSIAAFVGCLALAALAFYLAWSFRSRKIRELKAFTSLLENWLAEARKNAQTWQERHDKEQAAREKDFTNLAAVIDTLKARELTFASDYAKKLDALKRDFDGRIAEFRKRVEAAESKISKRGPGGKFVSKK